MSVGWYEPPSCDLLHTRTVRPRASALPHVFGAPHAQRSQLEVDPRRSTVGLAAVPVDASYLLLRKPCVGLSPSGRRPTISPTIEAALLGDLQRPAHRAHLVVCLLRLDKGVDHLRARRSSSLAKNDAAFFKISRSSLRTFTSLRRRRSSSFSSVVSPWRSLASISAWLPHFLRSVSVETSRSRAIFYGILLVRGVNQPDGFLLELRRVEFVSLSHLLRPLSPNLIA